MKQKLEVITCTRGEAREIVWQRVAIGFGLALWLNEKVARVFRVSRVPYLAADEKPIYFKINWSFVF